MMKIEKEDTAFESAINHNKTGAHVHFRQYQLYVLKSPAVLITLIKLESLGLGFQLFAIVRTRVWSARCG